MSKHKYIIKNCEQIHSSDNFCWSKNILCQDCDNCVMKQIVEECKNELGSVRTIGKDIMAEEILKLLDIQEVK